MQKILIASDTTNNHFGGVNLRMKALVKNLRDQHYNVRFINADLFPGFHFPFAKATKIPLVRYAAVKQLIQNFNPDYIHIETEGPIGWQTQRYCIKHHLDYTTAYSSRYDQQLYARIKFPKTITNLFVKQFHQKSKRILVRSHSIQAWLSTIGLTQTYFTPPGVNPDHFFCQDPTRPLNTNRPICLYVGRVDKEKNLEDFLSVPLNVQKIVVGTGAMQKTYARQYPEVQFVGYVKQADLHIWYNKADVFVFPSKSETLGNVIMEAMACGLPIAAYPVTGPIDLIKQGISGFLSEDLKESIERCLECNRETVFAHAQSFLTTNVTNNFIQALLKVN